MSFERWNRMHGQPPSADAPPDVRTGEAKLLNGKQVEIADSAYGGVKGNVRQVGVQFEADTVFSGGSVAAPTIGSPFSVRLPGLLPDTAYAYRAYVDTEAGQYTGDIRRFTLPPD